MAAPIPFELVFFSGTEKDRIDAKNFIRKFEQIADYYKYSQQDRVKYVYNYLRNPIRRVYEYWDDIDLDSPQCWEYWKGNFLEFWEKEFPIQLAFDTLKTRKKLPNETALKYANDILEACNRMKYNEEQTAIFLNIGLPEDLTVRLQDMKIHEKKREILLFLRREDIRARLKAQQEQRNGETSFNVEKHDEKAFFRMKGKIKAQFQEIQQLKEQVRKLKNKLEESKCDKNWRE